MEVFLSLCFCKHGIVSLYKSSTHIHLLRGISKTVIAVATCTKNTKNRPVSGLEIALAKNLARNDVKVF